MKISLLWIYYQRISGPVHHLSSLHQHQLKMLTMMVMVMMRVQMVVMAMTLTKYIIWLLFWTDFASFVKNPSSETQGRSVGPGERRDKSFQARAEKPLGTDSHQTISKRSSECLLLIGHKKCFVLLCPIGEQHLLSSFREFVHDGYWLDHGLSGSCTKEMHAVRNLSVWYKRYISKYW